MIDKAKRQSIRNIGLTCTLPFLSSFSAKVRGVNLPSDKHIPWATGGTNLISVPYPDNTIFNIKKACTIELTEPRILGPCYFTVEPNSDISLGGTGLPMMLSFKLINRKCEPLAGHEIEVWHCDNNGVYSADTSKSEDDSQFSTWQCAGWNRAARKSTWFRGSQISDSEGRVNFKTIFPGWYNGRTIHVHVRVKNKSGVSVTTQFCFDEQLTTEICTSHAKYKERGFQDTPLAQDRFFRRNPSSALFSTEKNKDGSLLAFKTLQVS